MSGGRRRWRAWGGLVLGLCITVIAVPAGGCGEEEPAAVQAARRFAQAVRAGEVEQVLALLDAPTVAHVAQAAVRASDQVGGRRNVEPQEMLQVVDVDPHFQVDEAELLLGDEQRAEVRLTGTDGTAHTLSLVNEDGSWRVHLSLPRAPMVEMGEMAEP